MFRCSAYDYVVPARGKELVKTDLQIELPTGCYGRVAPRSGLALKNFIDVGGRYLSYYVYAMFQQPLGQDCPYDNDFFH